MCWAKTANLARFTQVLAVTTQKKKDRRQKLFVSHSAMFQRALTMAETLGLTGVQSEIFDVKNLSMLTIDSLW